MTQTAVSKTCISDTDRRSSETASAADQARLSIWQSLFTFTAVFLAACFLFFAELGTYPLFNPDEALYAEPAREMLVTGEYITTLLNYVVRFTKPPLVIWAQALSYQVFGVNEFAARFVGAACGAILVACTYLFAERYFSRKSALLSSAFLMTAPLFIGTAREAITDMPLSLLLGGSLMSFFHATEQRQRRWCWLGYALIGFAVMTKGPVGLILPVAILGTYHLIRRDVWSALKFYQPWFGLLLVAAIAVPWFAVEIAITKGAYYNEFLVRENFQRFTSVVDHQAPWWYHLAAVAGGFLPWSVFLPGALFAAFRNWNKPECRVVLFCVCWTAITVAFFSAGVSKLLPYTVPAFPAMALLMGSYVSQAMNRHKRSQLVIPILLLAIASGAALGVVPYIVPKLKEAPVQLIALARYGLCTILALSSIAGLLAWRDRLAAALCVLLLGFYACIGFYGGQALSAVSEQWEGPLPRFAYFAGQSKWPVFVYHMRKPSIPFYALRQVIIPDRDELIDGLNQTNGAYIISKKKDLAFLLTLPRCRLIAAEGLYVLLAQKAVSGAQPSTYKPNIKPL
jgi:4-amino-4-deoxy-L-arabinose transferase-like glycosyltransferase